MAGSVRMRPSSALAVIAAVLGSLAPTLEAWTSTPSLSYSGQLTRPSSSTTTTATARAQRSGSGPHRTYPLPTVPSSSTTTTCSSASTLLFEAATSAEAEAEAVAPSSSSSSSSSPSTTTHLLTQDLVSKLRFRELRRELAQRQLSDDGTTSQLRTRLRQAVGLQEDECVVNEDGIEDDCQPVEASLESLSISFEDRSDPDYERNELVREIQQRASQKHWKAATRKLKRLTRRFPDYAVPEAVYLDTLDACMANRMQGARASEPARKILDQMFEQGYAIPESVGNYCIKNSLGYSPDASHQGFGGIDTALAMLAVLEQAGTTIQTDTYEKMVESLAREGSMDDALSFLRRMVVDRAETPLLSTFAAVAGAAVAKTEAGHEEKVFTVLAYAKAAGYVLEKMASTVDGRSLLASGVIAAERIGNEALGLRLLTAASQAGGVAPDRGDNLVSSSSTAAQRASTLIHKRAITKAVEDSQWKLAVKVLELMLERSLRPSSWVWRNVVTCCAKAEKSKKATALLIDWVRLYEAGQADKPPLSVFNTVMNACEICDEQELTLSVLDEMKKTHDTDGNLITFNIALKRLAKQGNYMACEGIIIGMLQAGVEPSVVSYTTAIAACVSGSEKNPTMAYEWLKRMRSRRVRPNAITYNTALSACLDGKIESTTLASQIATEMLADVNRQLQQESAEDETTTDEYTDVFPNAPTKMIARALMLQLKTHWEEGLIDKRVATETIRVPLLQLVDFQKSEAAAKAREQAALRSKTSKVDEDQAIATSQGEMELEYSTVASTHRVAEV